MVCNITLSTRILHFVKVMRQVLHNSKHMVANQTCWIVFFRTMTFTMHFSVYFWDSVKLIPGYEYSVNQLHLLSSDWKLYYEFFTTCYVYHFTDYVHTYPSENMMASNIINFSDMIFRIHAWEYDKILTADLLWQYTWTYSKITFYHLQKIVVALLE